MAFSAQLRSICKKSVVALCKLKHTISHTGDTLYSCGDCDKIYNKPSSHMSNVRIHTHGKSYSCVTCSKTFNNKSDLKRHERVHSENKLYTCDVCPKSLIIFYST